MTGLRYKITSLCDLADVFRYRQRMCQATADASRAERMREKWQAQANAFGECASILERTDIEPEREAGS